MTTTTAPSTVQHVTDADVFYVGGRGSYFLVQRGHGYVAIASAEDRALNGCHYWSHHGKASIYEFILRIHRDYALTKLFGETEEFDQEATAKKVKEWIIEQRREARDSRHGLTAEKARDLWEEAERCESEESFCSLPIDEPWYLLQRRERPIYAYFWDKLWLPFVEHVRAERAAGRLP